MMGTGMSGWVLVGLAALLCAVLGGCDKGKSGGGERAAEKDAVAAAEKWLGVVDAESYGDSWDQAASYFKGSMTKDKWESSLTAVRKPLGKLNQRKVKSTKYATSLPGAPDGEYVVIQFETQFENKKEAIETVTPMKDGGAWKVSGYFIK